MTNDIVRTNQDEQELIEVMRSSLYPGASPTSVKLVLGYCKASGLDPLTKPVHIVPMWDKNTRQMRDVIMPGIDLYRTKAARTGQHAGTEEPQFGPMIDVVLDGQTFTVPEWCGIAVYRMVGGEKRAFCAVEYWIENYATAGKDSTAPNTMWKKRPRGQLAKCFDSETEILTTDGFQKFSEVTGKVLYVSDLGLEISDSTPFSQEYDGEMIVADGTRLNFSVTPNHDMLTSLGKMEASILFDMATTDACKISIPRAPNHSKNDFPISDSVLRLIGYFMADGSHTGYQQFRIAVSRQYKIDSLRAISLHSSEGVKKDAGRVAFSNGREIVTNYDKQEFVYGYDLIEEFVSSDKMINVEKLLQFSQRQAKIIANSILEFDGSDNGGGVQRLSQKNTNVLASFEICAVHAGYSVSKRTELISDIGSAFHITMSAASHFPVQKGILKNNASLVKRLNFDGKVWCVTVPSGVVVVRRHGFSMLCGNCAEAQALRKGFPEVGAAPTAEEMEGKSIGSEVDITPRPVREDPVLIATQTLVVEDEEKRQQIRADLEAVADNGSDALKTAWESLTPEQRKLHGGISNATKARAKQADEFMGQA